MSKAFNTNYHKDMSNIEQWDFTKQIGLIHWTTNHWTTNYWAMRPLLIYIIKTNRSTSLDYGTLAEYHDINHETLLCLMIDINESKLLNHETFAESNGWNKINRTMRTHSKHFCTLLKTSKTGVDLVRHPTRMTVVSHCPRVLCPS